MPSGKKDLYIAASLSGLNDYSKLPAKMATNNPKILLNTAEKMLKEADLAYSVVDEERAYILYMKYFNVIQLIKKAAEYKKQKDYYDSLMGQKNLMKAIDKAEELSNSLKDRYDMVEAAQVAEKLASLDRSPSPKGDETKPNAETKEKEKDIPQDDKDTKEENKSKEPVKAPSKISPTELFTLLQDKQIKVVLMDVRSEQEFKESHLQHENCINIPADIVPPGTTVTYVNKSLPDLSKTLWYQRGAMDHIILLDWNSTLEKVVIGSPLCTLKDALFKYDSTVIIKSEPLVLEGGYDQWLLHYPQLTTNANVSRPVTTIIQSSSSTLDFDYPDFDEAFLTTPTPNAPKPEVSNQSSPLPMSNDNTYPSVVVNDLFGPGKTDVNRPSLPRIDRTTKPKQDNTAAYDKSNISKELNTASRDGSSTGSLYPSINTQQGMGNKETKPSNIERTLPNTASESSLSKDSSQLEMEREELEKLRRLKEEELKKFEREKEKIAQEHQAKLDRLMEEERRIQELKLDQTKDVANLMRMKKSLESDMKNEQSQRQAEVDFREKELARLQQEEEVNKKRKAEVERLRQERKKKEEEEEKLQRARDEAEIQALLQAQERARLEEERQKKELEEAERKAELLKAQEEKAKRELEQIKLEKQRQQEAKQREEERIRQEEIRTKEMEKKELEIKKQEEADRLRRQKEDLERKKKEKEQQEKEIAEQARKEAEEKLKRLELSEEKVKPRTIPSPNLPSGWEKKLDMNTRRYYYINHNTATTQWEQPMTPVGTSNIHTTKLKDEPSTPRRGLSRSNSSPNIAQMMADEEKNIPTINRANKPKPRLEFTQQPLVRPSPPRRAIQRNLNPIYGSAGRALTGLRNLGNTCYMNSTIQCLNNTSPLVTYFLTDNYLYDINRESELGSHGEVADEFAVIVKALWSGQYKCITPRDFKYMVGKHQPMFAGTDQQDSQEFLTFLLDGLHEGLNKIKHRPKLPEQNNDNLPDSEAADIAWKHHKMLNESIIVELFQGQLKSTLMCLTCKKQSVTFQAFMYLSLPIPSTSRCNLGDCIRQFLCGEKMTGSSRWKCPRCKIERDSVKKIDIWKLPRILLIGLNRFVYEGQWREKISSFVDFPIRNLDLDTYVRGPKYNLYGISNHFGTMDGGHYTAYCKNTNTQRWYKYDDDMVMDMSESDIKTSAAFVLYYTSIDLKPPDFRQNF